MEPPQSPRELEVTDPAQLRVLLSTRDRHYLAPFLGRETTVAEAARHALVKPNTMLKVTQRFVRAGVLRCARTERRGGSSVRYYTTVAGRFLIPFQHSHAVTLEEALLEAVMEPQRLTARSLAHMLRDHGQQLRLVFERSGEHVRFVTGYAQDEYFEALADAAPAFVRHGQVLRMPFHAAKAFQRELLALFERYDLGEGDAYVAYASLALRPARQLP